MWVLVPNKSFLMVSTPAVLCHSQTVSPKTNVAFAEVFPGLGCLLCLANQQTGVGIFGGMSKNCCLWPIFQHSFTLVWDTEWIDVALVADSWWLGGLEIDSVFSLPWLTRWFSIFMTCKSFLLYKIQRTLFFPCLFWRFPIPLLSKATYSCNLFVTIFKNVYCLSISQKSLWL